MLVTGSLVLAALAASAKVPDFGVISIDPIQEPPSQHVGAPAQRAAATDDDLERVRELLERQDRCILERDVEMAKRDFAEGFSSSDFRCDSSVELLSRWEGFLDEHDSAALVSRVVRAERVGDWIVADVSRKFSGVRRDDGSAVKDESDETHVLHDRDGRLFITAAYENESAKDSRLDRERRVYDARQELCFRIALPEPFVAVPRRGQGAALDELLLINPADDATLGLMVYDPTMDQPLEDLMWGDLAAPDSKWLTEPRRFERPPPGMTDSFEAEIEYTCEYRKGKRVESGPFDERVIYFSPGGRVVFAMWLRAPPAKFASVKSKVDQFARSLRLSDVRAGRAYATALLEANPRWGTLEDGVFRPAATPVELPIPDNMAATPLLGDHILRLRLKLLEDPKSWIMVRFFPSGEDRVPADKLLDHSVQRMNAFACAEGKGGDSHRSDATMKVLGRHGDWRGIEIVCQDGSRRNYQIVAVDVGDCHVQVQVLPGSSNVEAQANALKAVLQGLRERPIPSAPTGVAEAEDESKRKK